MGRLAEQTLACSRDQLLLQEPDERRFADPARTDHEDHGSWPIRAWPLSGRTNGLEDGIACVQQVCMFNDTFLMVDVRHRPGVVPMPMDGFFGVVVVFLERVSGSCPFTC